MTWLFLTGCGQQNSVSIPLSEPIVEPTQWFETLLTPDTWSYQDPRIVITMWTWRLVRWLNGDDTPERKYAWTKVIDKYDGEFFETIVTWYLYTYIYKDLWIKITTPPLYEPYFSQRADWGIFKRNGNIIYLSWDSDRRFEYIQKFTKDPSISFYDNIQKDQTPDGCKIDIFTWYDYSFLPKKNETVSVMFSDTSTTENTYTQQDLDFSNNNNSIIFLYTPKNPSVYYKVSMWDWCAPGPCSIFGKIEFF